MKLRDRIKELRRVPAGELLPNPKNWRTHPEAQQNALRGVLAEIGIADVIIVRETPHGLQIIDGHCRAEIAADCIVPVVVLDVTEKEADKLLATLDPLAAMAGVDEGRLESLLSTITTQSEDVQALLDSLAKDAGIAQQSASPQASVSKTEAVPENQETQLESPDDFKEVDENIEVQHTCPRCSYQWSGGT